MFSDTDTPTIPSSESLSSPFDAAVSEQDRNVMSMVREALQNQRAMLAYQPIVRAGHPDRVVYYEGLMRLIDHTGRTIPAKDFIGSVEDNELGRMIDCLALECGLNALTKDPGLRLAINMSARSIGYPRWMQVLRHGLSIDPTAGDRLILEITEHSAMRVPEIVTAFMAEMQTHGIAFALDDFGAGYTAFRYLKDFFFDVVKIDGQFIRGIHANPDNQVLAKALISICNHFDMFTVAENVETAEEVDFLQKIGVDCLQGYYFGAPKLDLPTRAGDVTRQSA